ncbi:MAG: hypothetical protein B7Z66_03210 [Chromatiales bacterium 21-64-14]|nr:MAG: hypothetical protein B7Z66_03210 [Chromatiales bacterium 21-64-14]HQU15853.1 MFS transporter [Gammaproteobacteria bacterium]
MKLPVTVLLLGTVSFLNDVASDMIMPLLPVFLSVTLGAGPAAIGLIEGLSEAAVSLLKLWSGRLGDQGVGHKRLAVLGYSISNALRPLLGLVASWEAALLLRVGDRVGKGIRTAPRDALLSASVPGPLRGRAFGLHRSMDHGGAMLGPLLASALLALGLGMRDVFLASVVPGVLAVLLLAFGLRADQPAPRRALPALRWAQLQPRLRALVVGAGALALVAVPDAFLILWLSHAGVTLFWIPLMWSLAHGVRAAVALPAGRWSDRAGRIPVLVTGWSARALILFTVPWVTHQAAVLLLFLAYAGATAATEGAERALIGDEADPQSKGSAFGLYYMTVGILALPGALWFGLLWQYRGMGAAFTVSGGLTLVAAGILAYLARRVRTPD